MNEIRGKCALVTGSSRGIGRATALALAQEGVHVAVNYVANEEKARETCAKVQSFGVKSICVRADVTDDTQVLQMVSRVERELGPIDILVNNAGMTGFQSIETITRQDWDKMIAMNLTSLFVVTQAVLPGMRKRQWGRIINIASSAAQNGGTVGAHYSASKGGVIGMTHFYAARLLKEGITVNSISPGPVDTELLRANPMANPAMVPVGRFGDPAEIAVTAVMMAKNGFITGQTVNVNGGIYFA